jgi:hypothetical protein
MPTNEKPAAKADAPKPICFVFPRGITAEEAARLVKEFVDKHKQADKPNEGDGGQTRK